MKIGLKVLLLSLTMLINCGPDTKEKIAGNESFPKTSKQREDKLDKMIADIKEDFKRSSKNTGVSELKKDVEQAIRSIPREEFVPSQFKEYAYENRALAIGHDQTISQPFLVALMTQLLEVGPDSIALEVGTGSGYQAAVLSKIVKKVYSIERVAELAQIAKSRFVKLGLTNIESSIGDGTKGWPTHAPFDAIIVTAGGAVTQDLKDQLKNGAKMVMPVNKNGSQVLTVFSKDKNGNISEKEVLDVRFVPLKPDK